MTQVATVPVAVAATPAPGGGEGHPGLARHLESPDLGRHLEPPSQPRPPADPRPPGHRPKETSS